MNPFKNKTLLSAAQSAPETEKLFIKNERFILYVFTHELGHFLRRNGKGERHGEISA